MVKSFLSTAWLSSLLLLITACASPSEEPQAAPTLRLLNHWDNLDGTIERGYAGRSIFWGQGRIDTLTLQQYGKQLDFQDEEG